MRCQQAKRLLDRYVTGELPAEARLRVETHVAGCETCRRELAGLRQMAEVFGHAQVQPVPDGFAQRVQALARRRIARPAPAASSWSLVAWWRTVSMPMRATAAAVLVIGLASGVLMGWNTWQAPSAPADQVTSQADPLAPYGVDYLTDAPDGSLAQTYLALVASPRQEGR
jgi:anti-sigma factor RsiW